MDRCWARKAHLHTMKLLPHSPQPLHALLQRRQLILGVRLHHVHRGPTTSSHIEHALATKQAVVPPDGPCKRTTLHAHCSPGFQPSTVPTFSCCARASCSARRCRRSKAAPCCCCAAVSWPQTAVGQPQAAGQQASSTARQLDCSERCVPTPAPALCQEREKRSHREPLVGRCGWRPRPAVAPPTRGVLALQPVVHGLQAAQLLAVCGALALHLGDLRPGLG